jgi:hypothetical protein
MSDSSIDSSPLRKPAGMAWESYVERRIREAQAAGAFDNLPGAGQPIPGIDDPPDENWWIKQKLREEGVNLLPPVLEARLDRERTLDGLSRVPTESAARRTLHDLNERIQRALRSGAAGPSDGVSLVDVEAELQRWREARAR